jgi:prevent-host-death family protein
MANSVTDDCRTIDELRHDIEAILAKIHADKLPITITRNGKPAAVLLDVAAFERMVHTLNLVRLLGPAEEDLLAGRVTPLDEFMGEFCLPTRYRVTVVDEAKQDVQEIHDLIARDKKAAAAKWVREFHRQARSLSRLPHRYDPVSEAKDVHRPWRQIIYGNYPDHLSN